MAEAFPSKRLAIGISAASGAPNHSANGSTLFARRISEREHLTCFTLLLCDP